MITSAESRITRRRTPEHNAKIGKAVAQAKRKPVGLTPVPDVAGYVYVLWSDGEIETREVK